MSKIFISYRRDDSAGSAGRLYDHLEINLGKQIIFQDVDSIPLGSNFEEIIEESIDKCDIVLAVIGRNYIKIVDDAGKRKIQNPNDFVNIELTLANKFNKKVIPILVDNALMPSEEDLPKNLSFLSKLNAFSIRHDKWRDDVINLADTLKLILTESEENRKLKNTINKTSALLRGLAEQDIDTDTKDRILEILNKIDMSGSYLPNSDMRMSYFNSSNFDSSNFADANFDSSIFDRSNFRNSRFQDADFSGVDLREIIIDKHTKFPK